MYEFDFGAVILSLLKVGFGLFILVGLVWWFALVGSYIISSFISTNKSKLRLTVA